jgi:hypothetical protein
MVKALIFIALTITSFAAKADYFYKCECKQKKCDGSERFNIDVLANSKANARLAAIDYEVSEVIRYKVNLYDSPTSKLGYVQYLPHRYSGLTYTALPVVLVSKTMLNGSRTGIVYAQYHTQTFEELRYSCEQTNERNVKN